MRKSCRCFSWLSFVKLCRILRMCFTSEGVLYSRNHSYSLQVYKCSAEHYSRWQEKTYLFRLKRAEYTLTHTREGEFPIFLFFFLDFDRSTAEKRSTVDHLRGYHRGQVHRQTFTLFVSLSPIKPASRHRQSPPHTHIRPKPPRKW